VIVICKRRRAGGTIYTRLLQSVDELRGEQVAVKVWDRRLDGLDPSRADQCTVVEVRVDVLELPRKSDIRR
jgi:hypothetical protein